MLGIDRAGASHLCLLVLCLLWGRSDTAWPVSRDLLDGALGHVSLEWAHPSSKIVSAAQAHQGGQVAPGIALTCLCVQTPTSQS